LAVKIFSEMTCKSSGMLNPN